ncbi:hypothetical protein KI688_009127 [Linnemannia hyalina]|uniref:Uncharacterized protein n=1 Tax=Linnemannia hyalina TaxID=64524 RepID=A0A9P7Y088_9FUNG|nr:hypothetical protein KI688_009127 [Linnemannia hyalina]
MAQPVRSVDRRFTTTAFEIPGYFVAQAHGVVRGITVRNPNAGKAFVGAWASLAGGESSTYIEMAEKARERAFLRMLEHAAAAGGNGMMFCSPSLVSSLPDKRLFRMTEVMAYGTAVTLVPLQQQQQQPIMQQQQQPIMQQQQQPIMQQQQQPIMQQPLQQPMYSPVSSPYGQPQHQQFSPALPPKN